MTLFLQDTAKRWPPKVFCSCLAVLLSCLAVYATAASGGGLRTHEQGLTDIRAGQPPRLIAHAIRLASITFRVPYGEMVAVARCETGGSFDPRSRNRSSSASGIFQILADSTWYTTPYRKFSPFDPVANALAAAWIVHHDGSWRQWTCQPG